MTKAKLRIFLAMRIKTLRKNLGLSQEKLAERIGCSWRSISNMERGKCIPDLIYLVKIAHFFHLSLDSFLPFKGLSSSKISENRLNLECQFINLLRPYDDRTLISLQNILKEQIKTLEECGFIHKRKLENFREVVNIQDDE